MRLVRGAARAALFPESSRSRCRTQLPTWRARTLAHARPGVSSTGPSPARARPHLRPPPRRRPVHTKRVSLKPPHPAPPPTTPHLLQAARWGVAFGSIGFFLLYEELPQLIMQTQYGIWPGWCAPAPTPPPCWPVCTAPPRRTRVVAPCAPATPSYRLLPPLAPLTPAEPPPAAPAQDWRGTGVWPDEKAGGRG